MKEIARIRMETKFQEADSLIDQKKFEDAYNKLRSIIEEEPDFGKAYNHLGWLAHWKLKDYTAAEDYYKKSMEISPEYVYAYNNYAMLLNMLKRWDELAALVAKALQVPGATPHSLYNELGLMFEKQGKYKEAIEQYRQIIFNSIDETVIENANKAIERCNMKTEMFR